MATPTNLPASFAVGATLTAAQQNALRGAFRILQVVQGFTTTQIGTSSATFIDTGLSATITPQSNTSKILVVVSQNLYSTAAGCGANFNTYQNATLIESAADLVFGANSGTVQQHTQLNLMSPATTSAITYKTQFARNSGGGIIYAQINGNKSTLTLFEVSA